MRTRVIIDFSGWREADLDRDARIITDAMKNNPYFSTLVDLTKAVADASAAYSAALAVAGHGSSHDRSMKEDQRKVLIKALRVLGFNINQIADGNRTLLESTGYPLVREFAGRKAKDDVTLEAGHRALTLTLNSIGDADTYMVQYTVFPVTDASAWKTVFMSERVLVIDGLEPDHKYAVRMAPLYHATSEPVFEDLMVSRYVE